MKNNEAGVSDIGDKDFARLVAQCDIKNDITRIVNFEFDEEIGFSVPSIKVEGENRGIRHSFRITEDAFSEGALVNQRLTIILLSLMLTTNIKSMIQMILKN